MLPLYFEANQGQTDPQVMFLSRGWGYNLFLTTTEAVFVLSKATTPTREPENSQTPTGTMLRMQLLGANPQPRITGLGRLPGKVHYFIGNDSQQWHTEISTYSRVRYAEIYPGIDLVFYGNQGHLEYDFVVASRADPKVITLTFEGAQSLHLDVQGMLILQTANGDLRLHKPHIYQEIGDVKQEVSGQYIVYPLPSRANKNEGIHGVSFQVAEYDTTKPLIIDPVLSYSTYLGGNSGDQGHSIAVDAAGNAYITGMTGSTGFPVTIDSFQPENGGINAFVTKVDATGSVLLYSTYLGGSRIDQGHGIAIDAAGNAYITGETESPDFPTTPGAVQSESNGSFDAFVTKVDASGSVLLYSSYLGGSNSDQGHNIAVDTIGNAYITGETFSFNFPTAFPLSLDSNVRPDAFVSKVDVTGSVLLYSTYLGGSGNDQGHGIAVDTVGNAYITGVTFTINFPTTAGAVQPKSGGGFDAFVTKVHATGLGLTITANPDPILVESGLTYAITIVNNSPEAATGMIVTDILPDRVALVSLSSSQGNCSGSSTITCALGTINNGGSATVTIVVTTPPTAGTLINSASVTSSVPDPDATDDSATVNTLVITGEEDCFFDPLLGRIVCNPDISPGPIARPSAGGCTLNPSGNVDPVLVGAVGLVLAYLGWKCVRRRR
jgi:uncharacterized repeat protein (TIGR01451 family)